MAAPIDPPEPVAAPPAEPAAVVTPPAEPQPGPWASDLATYFGENAEAIAAADRYMREKVQPHVTQLEQGSAPARELYQDLIANPQETLAEVFSELFEDQPELVERFTNIWGEDEPVEPAAVTPPADDEPEWAKSARLREEAQAEADAIKEGEQAYAEVLAELRTAHADLTDADMELIHPFMAAAPDPETAYAGYQAFKTQFAAANGIAVEEVAPEVAAAPPVLGSEAAVAATPPVAKVYTDFDDAWNDWRAEQAVAAPPVVGSA